MRYQIWNKTNDIITPSDSRHSAMRSTWAIFSFHISLTPFPGE